MGSNRWTQKVDTSPNSGYISLNLAPPNPVSVAFVFAFWHCRYICRLRGLEGRVCCGCSGLQHYSSVRWSEAVISTRARDDRQEFEGAILRGDGQGDVVAIGRLDLKCLLGWVIKVHQVPVSSLICLLAGSHKIRGRGIHGG